jgi:hypothetical protein
MLDFFLPDPLKFLWDDFMRTSLGGKKHEFKPLGNFPLSLFKFLRFFCAASKRSIERLHAF